MELEPALYRIPTLPAWDKSGSARAPRGHKQVSLALTCLESKQKSDLPYWEMCKVLQREKRHRMCTD